MKKPLAAVAVLVASGALFATTSFGTGQATPWTETFDGDPASPQAWSSPDWDIQFHSRSSSYWSAPEAMSQQHGGDCAAPPMTHPASGWPGTVYQCRNHLMTAINASDYGLLYLTPNRMADWSSGPAVIQWDMSTEGRSQRDWVDLYVTPFAENMAHPLQLDLPDLQGKPRNYLHVDMANNEHVPFPRLAQNGVETSFGEQTWSIASIRSGIAAGTNQASTRQTFRLTLSSTSAKFERLQSPTAPARVFWDKTFPALNFTSGVVQFGHHSYTPWKDGNGGPQTWHWDNVSISPSVPFTMIKADTRYVTNSNQTVNFASPAPANAYLRFSAIGTVSVSLDGGPYEIATRQWEQVNKPEHASNYFHPIPTGTQSVRFLFAQRGWYNGPFIAKDITVWSRSGASGGGTLPQFPPATATPTTQPSTATPTASSTPGASSPAATPTSTPRVTNATPTSTPKTVVSTPTPFVSAPTATATPPQTSSGQSWTATAKASSNSVPAGGRIALATQAKPRLATSALIDVEVYDPSGRKVFQQYWDRRSFNADKARSFSALWRVPNNAQKGTYTVKIGIFGVRWNGMEFWNDSATTFTVR